MPRSLDWIPALDRPDLLAEPVAAALRSFGEGAGTARVAAIDPDVAYTAAFCAAYGRSLDESANWSQHGLDLPYAKLRRQVELDALAQATPQFAVMTVCPSLTFGPEDPSGAPANKLLQAIVAGKVPAKVAHHLPCSLLVVKTT